MVDTTPRWCACGCNAARPCSCAVECGEPSHTATRPRDRVQVTTEYRKDGSIRDYAVRVWFPIERWGTVSSRHPTEAEAEAAADMQRAAFTTHTP